MANNRSLVVLALALAARYWKQLTQLLVLAVFAWLGWAALKGFRRS